MNWSDISQSSLVYIFRSTVYNFHFIQYMSSVIYCATTGDSSGEARESQPTQGENGRRTIYY